MTLPKLAMDFTIPYYLSGPMTGIPEFNLPAFTNASRELRESGLTIVSPHEIGVDPVGEEGKRPWQEYLREDIIPLIRDCRGIIMLRGWPISKGSRMELGIALDLLYPVYYYDNFSIVDMNRWGE